MFSDQNFDQSLRLKKGALQYHLDKVKAGRTSSSAGRPRPSSKANAKAAHLYSPVFIGRTFHITPKHNYLTFHVGKYYVWRCIEEGLGVSEGRELSADEIREHFMVVPKRKMLK